MKTLASWVFALSFAAACSSSSGKYNAVERGPIHTEMWRLMELTTELDNLMTASMPGPPPQAKAVELLAGIEGAAEVLAKSENRSRHPLLRDNAETFLATARRARTAAASTPPNYYYAGIVSGSCVLCHDPDGGIR